MSPLVKGPGKTPANEGAAHRHRAVGGVTWSDGRRGSELKLIFSTDKSGSVCYAIGQETMMTQSALVCSGPRPCLPSRIMLPF